MYDKAAGELGIRWILLCPKGKPPVSRFHWVADLSLSFIGIGPDIDLS